MPRGATLTRALIMVLAVASWAGVARAGVTLEKQGGKLRVRVQATQRGPWSPVGLGDARCLNPLGDLIGDGAPAVAESDAPPLVAWHRPSEGALLMATGGPEGWGSARRVAAGRVLGAPLPVVTDSGVVVAWQEEAGRDAPDLRVAWLPAEGALQTADLGAGYLLRAQAVADRPCFVVAEPASEGDFSLVVYSVLTPIDRPIEIARIAWSDRLSAVRLPSVEAMVVELPAADAPALLVSWRGADRVLGYVVVDEWGPIAGPAEVAVGNGRGSGQSALRAVLRDLGD